MSVLKARRLHVVVRNYLFAVCESLGALFHIPELAQWIPLAQGSWAKGLLGFTGRNREYLLVLLATLVVIAISSVFSVQGLEFAS